jgi:cytochrome c-type biogenesis protein CcmH
MSGWILMLLFAAAIAGGLWRWFRRDQAALQLLGAALLLACAGYAWQGRPGLAGAPKAAAGETLRPRSDFSRMREDLLGGMDQSSAWLTSAEPFLERGDTERGVELIRDDVTHNPRDMKLWLGLGDALVQHGEGIITPAAQMAFERAAEIAPDHPAPYYFFALAAAHMGEFDLANRYLQQVEANPRITDAWRSAVSRAREWMAARQPGTRDLSPIAR